MKVEVYEEISFKNFLISLLLKLFFIRFIQEHTNCIFPGIYPFEESILSNDAYSVNGGTGLFE